jgi:hypothetical protein
MTCAICFRHGGAELLAKLLLVVPLGQQLCEDLDRDQRVLQFVGQPRRQPCEELLVGQFAGPGLLQAGLREVFDQRDRDQPVSTHQTGVRPHGEPRGADAERAMSRGQHHFLLADFLARLEDLEHDIRHPAGQPPNILADHRLLFDVE